MREITVQELQMNPVTAIAQDWMLITAGCGEGNYNTMTASWGQIGHVWGHGRRIGTTVCYVRPQRYTKQFMDREELYTLTFFDGHREALSYLGTHSGRDEDKVAKTDLTPVFGIAIPGGKYEQPVADISHYFLVHDRFLSKTKRVE